MADTRVKLQPEWRVCAAADVHNTAAHNAPNKNKGDDLDLESEASTCLAVAAPTKQQGLGTEGTHSAGCEPGWSLCKIDESCHACPTGFMGMHAPACQGGGWL